MAEPTLVPPVDAAARVTNAELAFLYWRERANVAEEQADMNAATMRVCTDWARSQQ